MIRVNLNRTQSSTGMNYATAADPGNYDTTEDSSGALVKILLLLMGVVGLIGYEMYYKSVLTDKKMSLAIKISELDRKIQEKEPVIGQAEELQKEIVALESRIETIRTLAKERLREIKAIDFIQNTIPERAWI